MKNTISDLNNYLFEQLERINDDSLSGEQLDIALTRAAAVTKIAEAVIHNGELALRTMEHMNEYGYNTGRNHLAPVPVMLQAGDHEV